MPLTRHHRRRRWRNFAIIVAILALVCSGSVVTAAFVLFNRYDNKVAREDILGDVPAPQQVEERLEAGPLNFLILGSDSRGANQGSDPGGARSDTIMVVHLSKGLREVFVFSIPRDSYVYVPPGGTWRGGMNKINAAFAFGGAKLAASTVYELTKIPLDGAAIVEFEGIHRMVAAVGTVEVCIPYRVRSYHTSRVWEPGCHEMGPDETADFVRQRYDVPGGDFGRIKNQHLVVKALAKKVKSRGILTQPALLDDLLTTAAESVTLDKRTNLRELFFALKDVDPDEITFATVPYIGTMRTEVGSSVQLDMEAAQELFQAVREDRVAEWLAANPQQHPELDEPA